jgi:hypothetical protein
LGESNTGAGVLGQCLAAQGVANSGADYGVVGTSARGTGVLGKSAQGSGIIGLAAGTSEPGHGPTGVIGRTSTGSDGGVWGDNTGSGPGVAGTSAHGVGVFAQGGFNGVQATTANSSASGVWGENTGSGYGVGGKSAGGVGVYGTGTPAAQFDGNVVISGGNLTMQNGGDVIFADFAEDFRSLETCVEPGTVMVIDDFAALRVCDVAYDKRVAGVVSGAGNFRPAIILGNQVSEDKTVAVALMGKVYCKVDARRSPIAVGDLLTTSQTPGHAMKADNPLKAFGAVIGKALLPLKRGQGLIPILIALQ